MDQETKPNLPEIEESKATVTFSIPAYTDKITGKPFYREINLSTKKCYWLYKKALEKYEKESNKVELSKF